MTTLALSNNKCEVDKTSVTWHLSYVLPRLNVPVLVVDADTQANPTATFSDDDTVEAIWESDQTAYGMVEPAIRGIGDEGRLEPNVLEERPTLLPGDMRLARFEPLLSDSWPCGVDVTNRRGGSLVPPGLVSGAPPPRWEPRSSSLTLDQILVH